MNWTYVHLATNHIPVLGSLFGLALTLFAIRKKSDDILKFTLGFWVFLAIASIVVYLTGEPAEEVVEHLVGTSEPALEAHEDAAIFGFVFMEIIGAMALAALLFRQKIAGKLDLILKTMLILATINSGVMIRIADLGGAIRHPEIHGNQDPK
ncbi:MAG: hypothetical protein AB1540_17590 [Bdellovibrionota bacterium]